ncbi:uncharacterized protein LOC144391358 [Gasterosteus aculeatus]
MAVRSGRLPRLALNRLNPEKDRRVSRATESVSGCYHFDRDRLQVEWVCSEAAEFSGFPSFSSPTTMRLCEECVVTSPRTAAAGRPVTYCRLNHNVSILWLWFDVELDLKQDFRLNRRAMNALQRLLQREQDHGWGHQLETLIYVYWLAHGLSHRVVSSVFNVSKRTVHRVIHRVAQNIWVNLKKAISFPQAEELQAVGQGFVQLSITPAFNNVIGAIDGTHIRIKPPRRHQIEYLNYKGFYSINMQAIFDSSGRFLDVFIGYPGSVHDTRILKNSSF